jgi:hypothetical protein
METSMQASSERSLGLYLPTLNTFVGAQFPQLRIAVIVDANHSFVSDKLSPVFY